jgi:hypothetical protein
MKEDSMGREGKKVIQKTEDRYSRRNFFSHIYKYFLGFGTFAIASIFGFRRSGDLRVGKMKNTELGLSEAHGTCGASYNCSGGGGECGASYNCSGGGGQCGASYNCAGE